MSAKETMLCHQRVRSLFDYDPLVGRLVWKRKISPFSSVPVGSVAGTLVPRCCYRAVRIDKVAFYEHRLIWFWHHGVWPDGEVDHINRDRSDNRLENLRVVTREQNQQNTGRARNNTTGVRGVSFIRSQQRYRASIGFDGRRVIIGQFRTLEEAAAAYQSARTKHHSNFSSDEARS